MVGVNHFGGWCALSLTLGTKCEEASRIMDLKSDQESFTLCELKQLEKSVSNR